MTKPKLLLLAAACFCAFGAQAQWQWIDKDGRKVFSDRPPPMDVPDKSILKQPGGMRAAPVTPTAAADAAPAAPAAAKDAGKDKELEEKKTQAEAAEAAKNKAEEEKRAKDRAENCSRARNAREALQSGRPMMSTSAQGERGYMDEATRASEIKRAQSVIDSDCKR